MKQANLKLGALVFFFAALFLAVGGCKSAPEQAAGAKTAGAAALALPFDKPDIIVVGAGIAGLTASVKSAELGAHVLVFEQGGRTGGAGNVAGGTILGVDTIMEREAGIDDTVDLLIEDFESLGGKGNFDEALARAYGERSGAVVDWLDQTLGVVFANDRVPGEGAYDKMNRPRAHVMATSGGDTSYRAGMAQGASGLVKTLQEHLDRAVAEKKVYLALETQVTGLIMEGGRVTGVTIKDKAGGAATYRAPSIILATGGYGHNEAMLKQYNFTNVSTQALPGADGSGYLMAQAVGGVLRGMEYCSSYAGNIPLTGFFPITLAADTGGQTGALKEQIWVDRNGKRMANEPLAHTKEKSVVWNQAQDNVVYIILSAAFNAVSPLARQADAAAGWARLEELAAEGEHAFKGNTIEELADAAGIDPAGLTATVNTYNQDVKAGTDSVFGRTANLAAFDQGPFYAIRTIPFIMMTSGGVMASPEAEMLDAAGSAIPGVYLAGEIIGLGNVAGKNTIAGMGNGDAAVWGYIAAESAVKNALGQR